jgi:hypothetical protein
MKAFIGLRTCDLSLLLRREHEILIPESGFQSGVLKILFTALSIAFVVFPLSVASPSMK